ncbi:MAG: hypothetical protein C6H99_02110 [Epsilonproteobacteria bacterium]|nr:hypothetical protein [Campylobacterota bacterium]NPA63877.1 hypothetical protein [Campylobacterota bacterium]
MKYELCPTKDGSYTLYSKEYDECYHSTKDGALQEALKKHVEPAFWLAQKSHLKILDICFGLGINTLATIYHFLRQDRIKSICIYSPELDRDLLKLLPTFAYPKELEPFRGIVEELIENKVYKRDNIEIELFVGDAREYVRMLDEVDVIYQDAFSPKKNPTLWTVEYFEDLYQILSKQGVLTTYSIATPVRLGLWEAGFRIYEMAPDGVKKITIASKAPLPLEEVDMDQKARRATSKPLRDKRSENG